MIKKIKIIFIIVIFIILIAIISLRVINKKISPLVMDYSISEMKKITSIIINRSINSDILNSSDIDNLFITTRDDGEIVTFSLNSVIVNKITDNISDSVEDNLRLIEEGKYHKLNEMFNIGKDYFLVPSGIFFKNSLLSSIGPKIPISLKIIGNVTSGINTSVKEYGINNSLITIMVDINVQMNVVLPFSSKEIEINNQVPIAIKLIHGKIPEFYIK